MNSSQILVALLAVMALQAGVAMGAGRCWCSGAAAPGSSSIAATATCCRTAGPNKVSRAYCDLTDFSAAQLAKKGILSGSFACASFLGDLVPANMQSCCALYGLNAVCDTPVCKVCKCAGTVTCSPFPTENIAACSVKIP